MFKKTRIRLVLLNSIVFVFLLNGLGATLYFYMQYKLYKQVDSSLYEEFVHLRNEHFVGLFHRRVRGAHEPERRMTFLLWNNDGQVIQQIPEETFDSNDLMYLRSSLAEESVQTIAVGNQSYRVYTVPLVQEQMPFASHVPLGILQLVYNLAPEQNMLHNLLFVIEIGGIISGAIAVLAGFFLAERALVPIQRSWNKQQQFVADASHELRTPLSILLVNLERLFRHPDHTIEQESQKISVMIRETRRMNKLVSDLLTLARSDSNQLQILYEPVRLDEILNRVADQFRELASLKNITIETSIASPILMDGDEQRLHQLLVILLDNALKYTHEGSIKISCHTSSSFVYLTVEDTGVGIAKEDLPHIFDRFYRGDKARSRSGEGTGLGLSIAEWIIKAHHGKVRVESQKGVGTVFHITLPLKRKR
jgi:two-component system, OmpR family, sensor histidine kinase CiaH